MNEAEKINLSVQHDNKEIFMSKWDSSKSEHENMVNKAANIRELIWEHFPDNWGEMMGCPYSVLCYAEDDIKKLQERPDNKSE